MTASFEKPPLRKAADTGLHPSTPAPDEPGRLRRGTTADAVGAPGKDRIVDLGARVPKSLRKAVRQEAERRGVSVDDIVAQALRDRQVY